ncbi:MAG: hypothetical protein KC776_39320 [Myxococcales bacterium]|nr:hypothetical protein [Myxococcales bacterium]
MSVVPLPVFLTAYDPTDVPGGSLDPLGFGSGFNGLADELLPGLTGVASEPAYLALLCGALRLADHELGSQLETLPPAKRRLVRVAAAERLERAWAIGCALSIDPEAGDGSLDAELSGLRGVSYVKKELQRIHRDGRRDAGTRWPLLSRQYTYGMLGIYGGVADRLRLLDKADFTLTPSIGVDLGEAFLADTLPEPPLRRRIAKLAVDEAATLPLGELARWGERARPGMELSEPVARALRDGLCSNARRHLSLQLMESVMSADVRADASAERAEPGEVEMIERCLAALDRGALGNGAQGEHGVLRGVLQTILAFEHVYRWSVVGLERLLHVTHGAGDTVDVAALGADRGLERAWSNVAAGLPTLEQRREELLQLGLNDTARRLTDVVKFAGTAGRAGSATEFMDAVLFRHREVQHSKLDRGRRKLPWIERQADKLVISSNLAGASAAPIVDAQEVLPHAWRTWAARNFVRAVGGVS